jgi:hypothetical protein
MTTSDPKGDLTNVAATNAIQLREASKMDETEPKAPSLKHYPVLPLLPLSSGPPSATQTLVVNYPAARLSSSPASSPNIVEPSIERKGSVHPTLGNSMERGVSPGADFFDDQSSGSEWEDADDEDRTQTFSEVEGVAGGLGSLVHTQDRQYRGSRGRSRERSGLTALPPFNQIPTHSSLDDFGNAYDNEGPREARHVSLTRMGEGNVKVVHNHGSNFSTPRGSVVSNGSEEITSHFPEMTKPYPMDTRSGATFQQGLVQGRLRRNTSDSVIADSIINAHLTTMRALKALSPSGSIPEVSGRSFYSATSTEMPKARSFSDARHIKLSPISVADRDHLPSHFVKTPYPFTAKKEFPKPKTRPRHHNPDGRLDSGYGGEGSMNGYDDRKGKHVPGLMPSNGEYDLRSRLERNTDVQGDFRSQTIDTHCRESVVYLTLHKHRHNTSRHRAKIIIPSDLSTSSPNRHQSIDFDDRFFAECLRAGHSELAGSWAKRQFSARKLRYIRLSQNSAWSDSPSTICESREMNRLLASGAGTGISGTSQSPFSEHKLMHLYKHPKTGKARYTWVHWARRVANSNSTLLQDTSMHSPHRQASLRDSVLTEEKGDSVIHHVIPPPPDVVTTVQFVHTLSTLRICVMLGLCLGVSIAAALMWVFIGTNGGWLLDIDRQRANRVGSGMAVGVLVLLLEMLGFGVWVWRS